MKIVKVEAIPFAIPYRKPLRFASGEVHVADHVLVRVHTDDGVVGAAEAPPRPYTYGETQESIVAVVDKLFAPALTGLTLLERETVHARMDRTVGNPAAKAAVDMAIWDALGRTLGLSVSQLLGGWTDRMRVCHMVGFSSDAEMVAEAERLRDQLGIRTFKVKVGRRPIELDIGACRALRKALGPDVELYVDGNRGWTHAEAARALDAMADLDLTLAEELSPADDVLGRRWLTARTTVPTVADESVPSPGRRDPGAARRLGHHDQHQDGPHRLQHVPAHPPPVRGPRGRGRHGQPDRRPDRQRVRRRLRRRPPQQSRRAGELSNFLDMSDDLLTEPLQISGGELAVPPGPGIGIEIDPRQARPLPPDR